MFYFLLLLSFYLPFQPAINPAEGVDLASIRVLILVLFFAWLASGLKNKKIILKNNLKTALIFSFLFLSAFSVFFARNPEWSIRKLLFLFSIFPIYFVVSATIDSAEKMAKMAKALIFSGMAVSLIGIIQFGLQFIAGLEWTYKFWSDHIVIPFLGKSFGKAVLDNPSWLVNVSGKTYLRATSVFPDPHMFSFYLGMLIPLAIGLLFYLKKRKGWIVFSLIIFLVADLLTFSRGGYLGIFAGAVLTVGLFWKKINFKYKMVSLAIASLVVITLILPSSVSHRFYSIFNLNEGSNQGRIEIWKKASDILQDNFLIGVGIGNYPLEIKPTADYREPIYAHNTYLDIGLDSGIFNAIIWIWFIVLIFFDFLKKGKNNSLFLMGAVSITVFSVHSLVETAIYSPVVLTLFLILAALSNIEEKNEKSI